MTTNTPQALGVSVQHFNQQDASMIYKVEDYCHNQPKGFIYGMDRKYMHNNFTKRVLCVASVFALVLGLNAQNTLLFTEVCVANIDQTIDYSNNYGGWVELYNPTATSVSLDGWYISDDSEILTKLRLLGYGVFSYKYIEENYRKYVILSMYISDEVKSNLELANVINGKRVLVLDDTVTSGKTISDSAETFMETFDPKDITFLTLFSPLSNA